MGSEENQNLQLGQSKKQIKLPKIKKKPISEEKLAAKEEKRIIREEKKTVRAQTKELHKAEMSKRVDLLSQIKEAETVEFSQKHVLSMREKQNEMLKIVIVISFIMILMALIDNTKSFLSSGKTVDFVSNIVNNQLNINNSIVDAIINTGGWIYRAFILVKSLISHWGVVIVNLITLTLLLLARLFLVGKERQIKNAIAIIINIINVIVLFNLVLLLAEINLVDVATDLQTHTLVTVYKLIKKAIDMILFIVEMVVILKYSLFIIKKKN